MLLHNSIVEAIGEDGCSGVRIICDESINQEVRTYFVDAFVEEYNNLLEMIEDEDGSCLELDEDTFLINGIKEDEDGFTVTFDNLALHCDDGDSLASYTADEAIKKAIDETVNKFQSINYEGLIAFVCSDGWHGEVVQYEISSCETKENEIYEFVGDAISEVIEDEEFWELLEENLEEADEDDFKHVASNFKQYTKWIDDEAFDKLLEITENVDDEIHDSLEEFIETDEIFCSNNNVDDSDLPDGYMDALFQAIGVDNDDEEDDDDEDEDEDDD